MLLDFVLRHDITMEKINRPFCFCTSGGESADLKELTSSDFVYVMLIVYYVPIAIVLAISIFRNLPMTDALPLLYGGATALCYDSG